MRKFLLAVLCVVVCAAAGVWAARRAAPPLRLDPPPPLVAPVLDEEAEGLDGSLDGVDYDLARRLLEEAIAAHGESLYDYQVASRAEFLARATQKRSEADHELDEAFRHLELRDRSRIGSEEYDLHQQESIRRSRAAVRRAAEWHRATQDDARRRP